MIWAQQLHSQGITHLPISQDPPTVDRGDQPHRFVLWSAERPLGYIDWPCPHHVFLKLWKDAWEASIATSTLQGNAVAPPQSVSVVICTRDRPADLARCLASIPQQTRPPDQVIVVDNCSIGSEVEAVCRIAGVEYIYEGRPGLDIARNTGAALATGDIVAYTDDDVVLHPHWLECLVDAFDHPTILAVTGLVLPAELLTPAQWHFERHWSFGRGFHRIDFDEKFFSRDKFHVAEVWKIGAGASMAFRKSVFQDIGRFDERLDVGAAGCSGDSEFWYQVLRAGGVCRYEPSAVAFHYHRREWEGLRKQIRAYMRGHAAALLVQYERTQHAGNLRQLLFNLPAMYCKRITLRLLNGRKETDRFTRDEIAGVVSGVAFYFRSPRPAASGPLHTNSDHISQESVSSARPSE
jgi:glycosyltransferase involved in cell wall biosynthesis